jgi:hypothetical protein
VIALRWSKRCQTTYDERRFILCGESSLAMPIFSVVEDESSGNKFVSIVSGYDDIHLHRQ